MKHVNIEEQATDSSRHIYFQASLLHIYRLGSLMLHPSSPCFKDQMVLV